jgi:hypothetical protein
MADEVAERPAWARTNNSVEVVVVSDLEHASRVDSKPLELGGVCFVRHVWLSLLAGCLSG